jgi:hypothetical protein
VKTLLCETLTEGKGRGLGWRGEERGGMREYIFFLPPFFPLEMRLFLPTAMAARVGSRGCEARRGSGKRTDGARGVRSHGRRAPNPNPCRSHRPRFSPVRVSGRGVTIPGSGCEALWEVPISSRVAAPMTSLSLPCSC